MPTWSGSGEDAYWFADGYLLALCSHGTERDISVSS